MAGSPTVDANVPRFTQGVASVITAMALLVRSPALVAAAFAVVAVGAVAGWSASPLTILYTTVVRPRLELAEEFEPAGPPRFALRLTTIVLGAATVALLAGWTASGWALAVVVAVSGALTAVTGICPACALYERYVAP